MLFHVYDLLSKCSCSEQFLEPFLHPLQLPGCDAGLSLQAGTAPTKIPWAWGRVCHMLNHRVYQGEKTQITNYLTCKGILCSKSKHKCLLIETMREKEHELHQGSTHYSIQKEPFWIWDQVMVYPIPKWGSHSRGRSAKNRATDANTAWRQEEEGTGQAPHRT